MAHDQLEAEGQTARRGGARFVAAGVVGACVLGAGLGLWARPSSVERGEAPAPVPEVETAPDPDRRLQIVLDDAPAPIGPPLDVMPADIPGLVVAEPAPPSPAPSGLMKVDAPLAGPVAAAPAAALPAVLPAVRPEPKPEPKPKPKLEKPKTRPVAAKTEKPRAETKKSAAKVAKTEPRTGQKRPGTKTLAKADKPEKKAKAAKDRPAKLAKAEPKPKKAAKGERPAKLTKLVKAVKTAPKTLKASAVERKTKRDAQLAEAKRAKVGKAEKAAKAKPAPVKASAPKKKPVPRGEGPMRVARSEACASPDPGEALVCADPRLNQRERQLQRAMRDAEAAGVPASALRRQQERLRQARAAAARDGSWAVEDVYEARIAELNDLARDAREY